MSSLLKKMVMIISVIVFILFIALIIAAWSMGMFSPVTVSDQMRGPYYIVSIAHTGSYRGISEKIETVAQMLEKKQIEHSIACGIFFDDPSVVPFDFLRSEGGFLIQDSITVDSIFIMNRIPKRKVVVASIEANPALAWFKTYPALNGWIAKNSYQTDTSKPIIELYHTDGLVEVELPIIASKLE